MQQSSGEQANRQTGKQALKGRHKYRYREQKQNISHLCFIAPAESLQPATTTTTTTTTPTTSNFVDSEDLSRAGQAVGAAGHESRALSGDGVSGELFRNLHVQT